MAYNGFAIDNYLDAEKVTRQLDELIQKPVYRSEERTLFKKHFWIITLKTILIKNVLNPKR